MKKQRVLITSAQIKPSDRNDEWNYLSSDWYKLFEKMNWEMVIAPNSVRLSKSLVNSCDGIILTGGGDIKGQSARNRLEKFLIAESKRKKIPLLGVCRGAQFIAINYGAKLSKVSGHVRTRHKLFPLTEYKLWQNLRSKSVNSFHNYSIKYTGKKLSPVLKSEDGSLEAFHVLNTRIVGVLWHPERESNPKAQISWLKKWLAG